MARRRGCDGGQCDSDVKVRLWCGGDGAIAGEGAAAGYCRCYVLLALAEVPSDHLAAQAEVGVADVAGMGAEHSSVLAGVEARLAEARATHARIVADLEARAERAAKE